METDASPSGVSTRSPAMRRSRSFDVVFDGPRSVHIANGHSNATTSTSGESDDMMNNPPVALRAHRRRAERLPGLSIQTSYGSSTADGLSLEVPRFMDGRGYDDEEDPDGLRSAGVFLHRRVKSYNESPPWMTAEFAPRGRAYTKSFGNLVKHLAPSGEGYGASPAPIPLPSPYPSPLAKTRSASPMIWSPRSEYGVAATPVVDYPITYEFALVLHNKPTTPRILARNGLDAVGKRQMEVIQRCIDAGLEISVLSSSLYSRKYMVLLLRPTHARLQIEKSRLVLERWLQIGAVGEVPSEIEELIASSNIGATEGSKAASDAFDEDRKFTPAERIQTIARIISSTSNTAELNPPDAEISLEDENRSEDVIMSCFPLHNRRINSILLSKCGQWWWRSNEITNELRYYYGERVAFYFGFVFLYTKCLTVPGLSGAIVYVACRWLDTVVYMRALCIFGFCAVTVWGTWFLKMWTRKNTLLNDAWNLRLFKEADYPNATFKPQGYREVVDSHGALLFREPYYNPLCRIPAYIQTFTVFAIFIATYVLGITFFVQWYTAAMMAPVCSDCPHCVAFLSCFDTARPTLFTWRWFYILVQGILLGVSLDIFVYLLSVKLLQFFVSRENHATEAQFQRTMISRLFVINWISFFLWFILIAFVIVPFGEEVETWLSENLKYSKLTVDWENGVIDMSTALVTPLLITQALNLLIDTSLPHLFRRETMKASKLARKIMRANPTETLLALSEYQSSFENIPMDSTQTTLAPPLGFKRKIELQIMTPIRIPYIEKALGISIRTLKGFENGRHFMTADDVLEESHLPLYNAFPDYLRMVIQYGYVVMFSVVWPFCALAAFFNNAVHIHNCFYKLCILRRRPVPRKANSIGQWEKMLFITLILAVFIVVGLICVSTGELEYFLTQCVTLDRFNGKDFSMNPDFSCVDISSRFLVALVLEHAAILIVYLLMDNISDTPALVRVSFQRKKELIRRTVCGQATTAPSQPSTPVSQYGVALRNRAGTERSMDHV